MQGKASEFICSAFENFTSEQWLVVENVFEMQLKNQDYNALAIEKHGKDYETYLNGIAPLTIENVKETVGKTEFNSVLQEYIKGVCPALFYGV